MSPAKAYQQRTSRSLAFIFAPVPRCLLSLLSLAILPLVHCQPAPSSPTPTPVVAPAYARSRTRLYVQGGADIIGNSVGPLSNQFYALDLTRPWTVDKPTWTPLNSGGPEAALHSSVISLDGQRLLMTGTLGSFGFVYHIDTDTWVPSNVAVSNPNRPQVVPVEDLDTGLVYFAGGFEQGNNNDTTIPVYNFAMDSLQLPMMTIPQGMMTDRSFYAGVYVKPRKSILYFGGFSDNNQTSPNPGVVTEFSPSKGTWSRLQTTNAGPSHRTNLCMAASEDGTKVVVFGGMLDNKVVGSDTWILDVATLTWSSGPDYKTKRCMNACTIVGDTFIGWGGYDGAKTANGTAILFDIPTKSFVQQYSPPSSIAAKSTNKGAIIGACIGVIVLAIMVAGFVYWFRKRKRMNQDKDKASSIYAAAAAAESDMHDSGHGANPSPLPEPKEMPAPTPMFSPPSKADKYFEQARKEQQWPLQPISVRGSQTVLPLQRPSGEVYRQPYQQRESQLQIQLHPSVQGSSHQSRTNQDEERVLLEAMIRNQQQLIQIQQQMLDVSYSGGRSPPCPTSPTGYFFPTTAATSQVSQVVQRPSPTIQQQHTRPTLFIPPNPVQHNPHTLEDGQSAASSQTRRVNNIQMDYP